MKLLSLIKTAALSLLVAGSVQSANAGNPAKFANIVQTYACGGNETSQYVNIPNSSRTPILATLVDTNGIAGAHVALNNVAPGVLTFTVTSPATTNSVLLTANVITSTGSFSQAPIAIKGQPKSLKGKYPLSGGSAVFTIDLTELPTGTTVSDIYVGVVELTSTELIQQFYFDQFTYTNVPVAKDFTGTAACLID